MLRRRHTLSEKPPHGGFFLAYRRYTPHPIRSVELTPKSHAGALSPRDCVVLNRRTEYVVGAQFIEP